MNCEKLAVKRVGLLTAKAEALTEKCPRLKKLQAEIDRLVSNAPDKAMRQESLDIMYKASRGELHIRLNRLNALLDNTGM